jgi:predicted nucleic acid-binding protein
MTRDAVFLDSVGLIAIWNADDRWHPAARPVFADLIGQKARLVTTTYILLECGNAAARRSFRNDVIALKNALSARQALIEPTPLDVQEAWEAFGRGEGGNAGIIDHVSFVVMRRLGLTRAFSNDAHFRAAEFQTLF